MDKENWKDIKGYEGVYQISDLGNIKRVDTGKTLKPWKNPQGYRCVSLSKNNKVTKKKISILVANTFYGEKQLQVRHLNSIKEDDRLINLAYGTQSDNEKDKKIVGLDNAGSRNGMSKLTEEDVYFIKYHLKDKKQKDIAKEFKKGEKNDTTT